jgi:NAD(P)-dependent dehydrogenase (short-subunit alcohol dehydrogenase family)
MNRAAQVDLAGRRIVATGATPGSLGFATAAALADWGARVVVTTRSNTDAAVRALTRDGRDVAGHPLELTDSASVVRFAEWYAARADGLDVLVNNAGVHLDLRNTWTSPQLVDGHEIHWRTNYLGTMHVTELLLPLIVGTGRQTGDARVVTVVSKLHVRGRNQFLFGPIEPYHSWDAYGTSKLALIHAMNELARRHAADGVHAYSLHPGSVYSHIADRGLEGHRMISALRRVAAPIERLMLLSPADGAQTTLHCATAADLRSGYYRDCRVAEPSMQVQDSDAARRLWTETADWLGGQR